MADPDGSGEIDFEEFKVALFAVDPDSGNPVGFTPSALLSPLDAFEVTQIVMEDCKGFRRFDRHVELSSCLCWDNTVR